MRKPDPVEEALHRLTVLRAKPDSPGAAKDLRTSLASKVNLVVSKAAGIAGQHRIAELIPDLVAAFDRFMSDPGKLDKRCAAITEIAGALYAMDYAGHEVYLRGIRHVQFEPSFGPPVDAAVKLRAQSALGLVRTKYPDALQEVVRLLVDRELEARIGAVRAIASVNADAAPLLLRLKVLSGDPEAEVLGECFTGLLELAPEKSLPFVAGYADSDDLEISEAAVLALGASRQQQAFEILKRKWDKTVRGPLRKTLLLAMATARIETALHFLISLIAAENAGIASEAITALAVYRDDEKIRQSVKGALTLRKDSAPIETFRREFEN